MCIRDRFGGPPLAAGAEAVFCPPCGSTVDLARTARAGVHAGRGPATARLVADQVSTLAELVR
eukprot:3529286-Alexandrium_andersonii.AAC.1